MPAFAATSDESEIMLLRKEIAEMKQEMRAMHQQIHESTVAEPHSARSLRRRTAPVNYIGAPEAGVHIGQVAQRAPLTADEMRPPPDRGIASSWNEFQRAFQRSRAEDESVHIGGVRIGFPNGRPTIATDDGAYALSIGLAFHEDFGGFFGVDRRGAETRGTFPGFTSNTRRMRIFFTWRYKNWVANVTPDFGGSNELSSGSAYTSNQYLYEANLNYTGFKNTILTVGYFQPRVTEEDSESSNDFMMMERPGITDVMRSIAAGDARFSIGGLHYDKRWWIAGYFTGQSYGNRAASSSTADSQTGGTFRVAGRPVVTKDIDVHVGVSAIGAFKPTLINGTNGVNGTRSFTLSQRPELNLTSATVAAAMTDVADVWSAGPELGIRYKNFLIKSEYYHIGVDRSHGSPGQSLPKYNFDGYYVTAGYTLFGKGRSYNVKEGAFAAPGVEHDFDPSSGHWGALEAIGRWSVTDLDDKSAGLRGGKQTIWAAGLNWYPNRHFRVMIDYNHFIVTREAAAWDTLGRNGNSIAARIQAAF
ncbi:polyphosphate-selective porin O [Ameyamaea chiangmaiensis NBRC 103196]|nr:polyphosphate-selective porin O [Ameyamaea chiangmaiensis NBRC 103196]